MSSSNKLLGRSNIIMIMLIAGLITAAAFTRLLPHPPNFTPVIAIALFAGVYYRQSIWAWFLPLAVMVVSDLGLWFLHGYEFFTPMRLVIYVCLFAIVGFGIPVGKKVSTMRIAGGSLAGAVLFFIVTNFFVWASGKLYPMTWEGLMTCYTAAIPFFRNTLMSTVLYSAIMFGAVEFAKVRWKLPAHPLSKARQVA